MLKRVLDTAIATGLLLLLSPLMLLLAAMIRLKLGRPILFRQERSGYNGRPFVILKFRTMLDAHSSDGKVLPDEQRLTAFGRRLRASSLDELPELINVIRGEMSLVGPRPLLTTYMDRYTSEQNRRHEVLPGITGWAQVNGRNSLSWEERFRLDIWYVDQRSLLLDCKILLLTLSTVLSQRGVSSEGHATMHPFTGTDTHITNINHNAN